MRRMVWLFGLLLGCSSSNDPPPEACSGAACPVTFDECPTDSIALAGGGCRKVGVPADGCATGFRHDAAGGCVADTPSCTKGALALPGETACHEVFACTELPTGSGVLRVDKVYTGGASDGSVDKPFTTIQAALTAASTGNTIAVADGVYEENLVVSRALTLVGRCPSRVEIRGSGSRTIALRAAATLRGVAVTGTGQGVAVDGVGTRLEGVWIHDTGASGIATFAPGKDIVVSGSLIESTKNTGLYVEGSGLSLERSVVRDVPASTNGGNALQAQISKDGIAATVSVKGSLLEKAGSAGVLSYGSDVAVEGSLLRELGGRKDASACVIAQPGTAAPRPPSVSLVGTILDQCKGIGVRLEKAALTFDRTTLRKVLPTSDGSLGSGIDASGGSTLTVRDALVTDCSMVGLLFGGSSGTVERTIVRAIAANARTGNNGIGVAVLREGTSEPEVTLDQCAIVDTRTVAVWVSGSKLSLLHSTINGVLPQPSTGTYGDGVEASAVLKTVGEIPLPSQLTIVETSVRGAKRAGFAVLASSASLSRSASYCAAVDLAVARSVVAVDGTKVDGTLSLDDQGGNGCGCGTVSTCTARQDSIEPVRFARE